MQNDIVVFVIKSWRKLICELKKPVIRQSVSYHADILPKGNETANEGKRPIFRFSYVNDMQIISLLPFALIALAILFRFCRFIRKIF